MYLAYRPFILVDMCKDNPCKHDGLCENVNNALGYECFCMPGWIGINCTKGE